jgi:hypothetical protein
MTVAELISLLQKLPQEAKVCHLNMNDFDDNFLQYYPVSRPPLLITGEEYFQDGENIKEDFVSL